MKKMMAFALVATSATLVLSSNTVLAAAATGTVKQVVNAALSISNTSDLDFGTAVQGDALKTVAPGTTENAQNGSFAVTGQANTAYTIALPADGAVTMTTGAGGANQTIAVSGFASFPAAGANGMLDANGSQALLVGASRAALTTSQAAGSYTGTYTVTVVY